MGHTVTGEEIVREQAQLASKRGIWESHWREVAQRVIPRLDEIQERKTPGEKKSEWIFDSTAPLALERFAAIMESLLTPRSQQWHKLRSTNKELNEEAAAKKWFEDSTRALFQRRYSPKANYASQQHETYMGLGSFGTGCMFTDEWMGNPRYRAIHLAEIYCAENFQGIIDTIFRKFQMTARQAAQAFGEDNLPDATKGRLSSAKHQNSDYIHLVRPRDDLDPERLDTRGMAYESYYVSLEGKQIVRSGGYHKQPYTISRYVTGPKEVYGRSPAMLALGDIKMINEMYKTTIRAAHMLVRPPLLVHDDGVIGNGGRTIPVQPGGTIQGGVTSQGRPKIIPLDAGGNIPISLEMMDRKREAIQDAFLVTIFQILIDHPRMTATEVLMRAQERGALLSPTMGRQQSEALGPQIERELDIGIRNGWIDPPPEVLLEAGGEYEIEYVSPLSRAQRSEELLGIQRTVELVSPLAAADPSVMDIFESDEIARISAEITGAPLSILKSKEDLAALRKAQGEQAVEDQQIEQAAPVAAALKDAAAAGQMMEA